MPIAVPISLKEKARHRRALGNAGKSDELLFQVLPGLSADQISEQQRAGLRGG